MTVASNEYIVTDTMEGTVIEARVSGRLDHTDYDAFNSAFTSAMSRGEKPRLLVVLENFEGWTAAAAWDDLKFDIKHFNHVDRIAIVGETKWERLMTSCYKPFTLADVRYFDKSEENEARQWIVSHDD